MVLAATALSRKSRQILINWWDRRHELRTWREAKCLPPAMWQKHLAFMSSLFLDIDGPISASQKRENNGSSYVNNKIAFRVQQPETLIRMTLRKECWAAPIPGWDCSLNEMVVPRKYSPLCICSWKISAKDKRSYRKWISYSTFHEGMAMVLHEPIVFRPKGNKGPGNRRKGGHCVTLELPSKGKVCCRLSPFFSSHLIPIPIHISIFKRDGTSPNYNDKWPYLSHILRYGQASKNFFPRIPMRA